jgi:RNA 2',3'-cyclic 3'-phosphodiesterase
MSETERLFIGVPVDESARFTLLRQLPRNIPGKPSPPENWHFTLRFLGSTGPERRDALIERLASTRFGSAFDLSFDRLGAFPNSGRARVLWVGAGAGHARLEGVAQKVEEIARSAGFEAEKKPFRAHLTISRMKEPQSVSELLARARPVQATMRVEELILYRSRPGGAHSQYSVVMAFPLK